MNNYLGFLIRQKRLMKNISQEGLCKGICVVSYLSKIEKGLVTPSSEIKSQLLKALDIEYITDEVTVSELRELLFTYYDQYFHGEDTLKSWDSLENRSQELESSELQISFRIAQIYQNHKVLQPDWKADCSKQLKELEDYAEYMEPNQRFLFGMLMGQNWQNPIEVREKWYHIANQEIPCCLIQWGLAHMYFIAGKYLRTVEYSEKAYSMAAEEGNVSVLLESSHLLAICYSNQNDMINMMRYFRRTIELARTLKPELMDGIYYNIGASYTQKGEYKEAIRYLKKGLSMQGQCKEDLLLEYHKLTYAYFKLGDKEKSLESLRKAEECIEKDTNETLVKMIRLLGLVVEEKEETTEYEVLLEEIYQTAGESLGYGFKIFHGKMLVELYKKQRKYKEALEVTDKISIFNP